MELYVGPLSRKHLNKNLRLFILRKSLKQKLTRSIEREGPLDIGPIYTVC